LSLQLREVIDLMDGLAPPHLAFDHDNVGLQIGDPLAEVRNIITVLDMDVAVLDEALSRDANVIISHHPLIFHPLKAINTGSPEGALIETIIHNNVNVFVAHTNLDVAPRGVNSLLAELFALQGTSVLKVTASDPLLKLVVFVPGGYEGGVREAITDAGGGWIGNYSHCTFQLEGSGTFMPREGSRPFSGEEGRLNRAREFRLETVMPLSMKTQVLEALQGSHPYEEVAYDLYELAREGIPLGLGRLGTLGKSLTLKSFSERCKKLLEIGEVQTWGDPQRSVKTIALCGGSGGSLVRTAAERGADVLVSGDLKYHDVQLARALGLALVDAGHYGTEYPIVPWLAGYLQDKIRERGHSNKVWPVPNRDTGKF